MLWQRAIFSAGLCIHGQHCAVNGIKVGKIIRCLRLPQFAIRQRVVQQALIAQSPFQYNRGVQAAIKERKGD